MPSTRSITLTRFAAALCLGCLPLALGCGDDDGHEHSHGDDGHSHDEVGPPSGATCPDDAGTLTYEDFGKPFMEKYCTRCHSSELEGDARNEAPAGHDFDSLEGILLVADHVDQLAAFGPESTNDVMPPNGAKPTTAEREMLGQWLACELQ